MAQESLTAIDQASEDGAIVVDAIQNVSAAKLRQRVHKTGRWWCGATAFVASVGGIVIGAGYDSGLLMIGLGAAGFFLPFAPNWRATRTLNDYHKERDRTVYRIAEQAFRDGKLKKGRRFIIRTALDQNIEVNLAYAGEDTGKYDRDGKLIPTPHAVLECFEMDSWDGGRSFKKDTQHYGGGYGCWRPTVYRPPVAAPAA